MENSTLQQKLEDVGRRWPGWYAWQGVVAGVLYVRRPNTSPPAVFRGLSIADLDRQIRQWESDHESRWF